MNIKPPAAGSDAETEQPGQDDGTAAPDQAADQPETSATDQAQDSTTGSNQPTKDKPEKGQEVEFDGKKYQWLGAQWAEVNPETGKAGKMAEKGIVKTLNDLAGVGKTQDKPVDSQEQPAGDTSGTADKKPAPAGTIGLAQQGTSAGGGAGTGGTSGGGAGSTAGGTSGGGAGSTAGGTSGGGAGTSKASGAAAKGSTAGSGKIDVFALAKIIKQQKPEVVEAVKKILSSRESQRAD
jgi:hypothetical protein